MRWGIFAWKGCPCRSQTLAMSLARSSMSLISFYPPLLLAEWMSPHYKFQSANLRAPAPPGSALRSSVTRRRSFKGVAAHIPFVLPLHGLVPGSFALGFGARAVEISKPSSFAASEHIKKRRVCDEFLFPNAASSKSKRPCLRTAEPAPGAAGLERTDTTELGRALQRS